MVEKRLQGVEVTPEIKRQLKDLLKTPDWHTVELLLQPASKVHFVEVERDLDEPAAAREIRQRDWLERLQERMSVLTQVNPERNYTIHLDDQGDNATGRMALFEVDEGLERRRMWDGTTITLAQRGVYADGGEFFVSVYPISYTEWVTCSNPDYTRAFRDAGLPLPYAGVGASVFMETKDGFVPLTRRGIETPVYPGRLYSPGGGPRPGQTSTEALLEEIVEETGLKGGERFNPADIIMMALIADSRYEGSEHSRPELVAYLPVNATFREIEEIQHEVSIQKGQRQEDVWGIVPISTFRPNLTRTLLYSGFEMCPPTEAGIAHLLFYQMVITEGLDRVSGNMTAIMQRLQTFERVTTYNPPIKRLATL